jgi:hypothetical protein
MGAASVHRSSSTARAMLARCSDRSRSRSEFGVETAMSAPAISLPPKFNPLTLFLPNLSQSGDAGAKMKKRQIQHLPTPPNSPLELVITSVDNDKVNNFYFLSVIIPKIQCAIANPTHTSFNDIDHDFRHRRLRYLPRLGTSIVSQVSSRAMYECGPFHCVRVP